MKSFIKILAVVSIALAISCSKKQHIPPYSISKVFKTDSLTTVDVRIAQRMPAAQLVLIAGKIKIDSVKITNLAIHYLLPGNTDVSAGDHSFYAAIRYLKDNEVKQTDTVKDNDGNTVRLNIFGLDSAKAQALLALQPDVIVGKNILGKFVDDYAKTLIIPFKDPTDKKDEIFVIELNAMGNIVSSTVPQKDVEDGVEKWKVDKNGDYITIKDSVLAQYGSDGLGLPFNSIKSGK
ncbi:MAG TPA: hypothetical protein VFE53_04405 [Mucilaginibacter sp.]|jgi:hypothetical protein|nr:hypothetical protein [Mucilaginibacter sp.]